MRSSPSFLLVSRKGPDVRLKPALLDEDEDVQDHIPLRRRDDLTGIDFHVEVGYKVVLLVVVVLTNLVLSIVDLLVRSGLQ